MLSKEETELKYITAYETGLSADLEMLLKVSNTWITFLESLRIKTTIFMG